MKLRERCVCGAEFEAGGDLAIAQMNLWRVRHDAVCRATLPKQSVLDREDGLFGRVRESS